MSMLRRFGPGPVFVYEAITTSRRWQQYALRSLAVLALLAGLWLVWVSIGQATHKAIAAGAIREIAGVGQSFYMAIAFVQISLLLLAAPAATAGAICLDRARGELTHMLVTDLSDAEIVLGKLLARLGPVFGLVTTSVPVLALATLLGGIDPAEVVILMIVSMVVGLFGCSLAMAFSVRATKTHEVLMAVYTVWAVLILGPLFWWLLSELTGALPPPPDWLYAFNPYFLVISWLGENGLLSILVLLGGTLAVSAGLIVYSIWRLRGDLESRSPRRKRRVRPRVKRRPWWPGPSLDGNPVLWREWQRSRPSRIARVVWGLFLAVAVLGTEWAVGYTLWKGLAATEEFLLIFNGVQVGLGLLIVSVTAPTALAEERVRGSLEALMTTPLSTFSIVSGKWWASYRVVPRLAILPLAPSLVLALASMNPLFGRRPGFPIRDPITVIDRTALVVFSVAWVLAHGAVVTSLGLALATWMPRVGRAMAVCVSCYVISSLGGFFLLEFGFIDVVADWFGIQRGTYHELMAFITLSLVSLNPIGAQCVPGIILIQQHESFRSDYWLGQAGGLLVITSLAAILFGLTVLTFDRCLGRTSERPRRVSRPPRRLRKARPTPIEPARAPELATSE